MKTSAPVHVDRLAKALKLHGVDLKRSKVIEIAAAAFGFHNSNEFQAAARAGDLAPPDASAIGELPLQDGTRLVVLRGPQEPPYAIARQAPGTSRADRVGITPYGGLVTLPDMTAEMPAIGSVSQVPAGHVVIDADTLSTLVEAADGHGDTLQNDLEDDGISEDHRVSTQETLDDVNAAVTLARSLYGSAGRPAAPRGEPAYDPSRFVLLHRTTVDRLVGAAQSHLDEAVSGVEEGLYDADENEWTGDLQKAIDAAQAALPAEPDEEARPSAGVAHVAIMRTPHHDDVRFSVDPAVLERMIADHCRQNWGSLTDASGGSLDPALLPDAQVVETFYAAHSADEDPSYALERREIEIDAGTAAAIALPPVPRCDRVALAESLEAGVKADIWDTDAAAREDADAVEEMAGTKAAMTAAAAILRNDAASSVGASARRTDAGTTEPAWLTDVEGDVIYDVSRDELEANDLDYTRGDGKNDWLPLTEDEYSYLQPGVSIASDPWAGKTLTIPGDGGLEVRLGQSCLWKGKKWLVPSIEFAFGEDERSRVFREVEDYVRDLRPLVDRLGGEVRVRADATDYAHEVEVFLPMELALSFEGTEDWRRALEWLLCPADMRDRLARVMATFNTPTSSPGYEVRWDATFDVLQEGMARAQAYVRGDNDDEMTMRLAQSGLAHKDAWSLWNEDWDLELDLDALRKLYRMK